MQVSRHLLFYKLRAAAASFAIFLLFAVVLAFITYHYWYPDFLFWVDGGIQGLRLVYAVDFVLGPLLALVFFHPEKSRGKLVFDIVFIAVIQLAAMSWGAYQVYKERPIGVVYGNDRFISVATGIMSLQRIKPADLEKYSPDHPPLIYRRAPVNEAEKRRQVVLLFQYGIHHEAQAWLFQPFAPNRDKVFAGTAGVVRFLKDEVALQPRWQEKEAAFTRDGMSLVFYEGRFANAVLAFDAQGRYQDYLNMGEVILPGGL